ncbi:MAG: hypothetical protein GF383_12065 [Candidatus Lokiarchaeota archaeon]|nr:hypothetical protein [Candidatus Lokiarchaeota archaeon]MBD3341641.1 hypothetical protein [Candidatus Lokiarchaeota archaeon]
MKSKLVSLETIDTYKKRIAQMRKLGFSKEGDILFIEEVVAVSEQVENLKVIANVNGFIVECDEPRAVGGTDQAARPVDLFLAAIANCLEIGALVYLSFSNLKVESIKTHLSAKFDKRALEASKDAPLPGFYDFKLRWIVKTEEPPRKIEKVLQKVEASCPVMSTLRRKPTIRSILKLN